MKNTIPKMIHKWGKYWQQPNSKDIVIDDDYALMSRNDFDKLLEYSASFPTGVYPGKMFKRMPSNGLYLLVWFSEGEDRNYCNNNYREILIEEDE